MSRHKPKMTTRALAVAALLCAPLAASIDVVAGDDPAAVVVLPENLEWTDAVVSVAVAWGDEKTGPYGKFVRFSPHFESPLHLHTNDYRLVVVRGTLKNPLSKEAEAPALGPGTYSLMPGGQPHITMCVSDTDCVIYVHQDLGFDFVRLE